MALRSWNRGKANPFYGKKHSPESIEKMRLAQLGKKFSEEHRRNLSLGSMGQTLAEKNGRWKGNNVGLAPLHIWIRKRLPKPELCQICHSKPAVDLSNISGKYLRDLKDYQWLCKKCHRNYDFSPEELSNIARKGALTRRLNNGIA